MPRENLLARIFKPDPDRLHLTGFPNSKVLSELELFLGREKILGDSTRRAHGGQKMVPVSFDAKYVIERQKFFRRLHPHPQVRRNIFDKPFPGSRGNLRDYTANEPFFLLCQEVEEALETARIELDDFRYLPEARRVLSRIDKFNATYGNMLGVLRAIGDMHTFAIDTETGEIANIAKMPIDSCPLIPKEDSNRRNNDFWSDI